jgi:hypothetical protein
MDADNTSPGSQEVSKFYSYQFVVMHSLSILRELFEEK